MPTTEEEINTLKDMGFSEASTIPVKKENDCTSNIMFEWKR